MAQKVLTASGQIKGGEGNLMALCMTADGVTSGNKVEIIDSTSATGTAELTFVFGNTDDVIPFYPCVGMHFDDGIYCKITKTTGTLTVSAVYD